MIGLQSGYPDWLAIFALQHAQDEPLDATVVAREYLDFLLAQPDTAVEVAHVTPGRPMASGAPHPPPPISGMSSRCVLSVQP
jgi:hypothetical protein